MWYNLEAIYRLSKRCVIRSWLFVSWLFVSWLLCLDLRSRPSCVLSRFWFLFHTGFRLDLHCNPVRVCIYVASCLLHWGRLPGLVRFALRYFLFESGIMVESYVESGLFVEVINHLSSWSVLLSSMYLALVSIVVLKIRFASSPTFTTNHYLTLDFNTILAWCLSFFLSLFIYLFIFISTLCLVSELHSIVIPLRLRLQLSWLRLVLCVELDSFASVEWVIITKPHWLEPGVI